MSSVLVWDIETIPDLDAYARATSLPGAQEEEIRQAIGKKFPKPPYHSIVCIGAVIAENVEGLWEVKEISAPHIGEQSEKEIIDEFLEKIDDYEPQLVTYNGSSFDFPVLRYRAMIHKLSAPGLFNRPYFNRYSEDSIDLCDALSSFGSSTKMKLDEICKIMGLDGKPSDIDGSQVLDYYKAGKITEISEYCKSDVINTYRLWLRHELFRDKLTVASFHKSENNLVEFKRSLKCLN